jgi:hypothetical protein
MWLAGTREAGEVEGEGLRLGGGAVVREVDVVGLVGVVLLLV